MNNKIITILVLALCLFGIYSCKDYDFLPNSHTTKVSQIDSVVLKPQNVYLIADGKAKLDLTPMLYIKLGKTKTLMLRDRIKDSWLEYVSNDGVKLTRFFSTNDKSLIGKQIEVKVKIKGTSKESNAVKINIVGNQMEGVKDITYPVVFHIITEQGQEERTGVRYSAQLLNDVLNKWNLVFAGKITDNPVGVDTHIRFKMAEYDNHGVKLYEAGIHRVYVPEGTFGARTNMFDIISKNDCVWPADKYINIWIDANDQQPANDQTSSSCAPSYTGENPLQGISTHASPFARFFKDIENGIIFKANEIKQLNKKYSTFYGYKPGYNELIHYLGIYFGLLNNNNFGSSWPPKPNSDGVTYCPDTPVYHSDPKYFKSNQNTYKETDKCFYWSENIMDDPTGFHTSVSQDQALRMRWVAEHCENRFSWKSNYAFTGK